MKTIAEEEQEKLQEMMQMDQMALPATQSTVSPYGVTAMQQAPADLPFVTEPEIPS